MRNKKNLISKTILVTSLVSTVFALSGCTGMSGSFSCNEMPGDHCTPVSVINQQVDEGMYDPSSSSSSDQDKKDSKKNSQGVLPSFTGFDLQSMDANESDYPIRQSEMTTRLWIAPYTDEQDNFHQANLVYTVLTPSYWQGSSQAVIQKQG
jgi:conjugal transfer pilus assembly protein TraV